MNEDATIKTIHEALGRHMSNARYCALVTRRPALEVPLNELGGVANIRQVHLFGNLPEEVLHRVAPQLVESGSADGFDSLAEALHQRMLEVGKESEPLRDEAISAVQDELAALGIFQVKILVLSGGRSHILNMTGGGS